MTMTRKSSIGRIFGLPGSGRSSLRWGGAALVSVIVAIATFGLPMRTIQAQDWPTRPVKIVVPYGPGGISDVVARMVADPG